ncbi:MAG: formylglycine-generating enzyme family protein, partial [Gammaproteobacteria bacterium]|nr:formylglycine-generating enzyme family protein [Gammaproteobacteria bacterium]
PPKPPTARIAPLGVYRDKLRGGGRAPIMLKLPGGSFMMGSKPHRPHPDEHPRTAVVLRGFSISKYEVTFQEYLRFAQKTKRRRPDDREWGAGTRPIINISWHDATAYTQWLTAQTGHQYRLPSEREWEYAAAAGTDTAFWWGKKTGKNHANCSACGSKWDSVKTAPVGRFRPNKFGLFDTVGNVMEWTISCYHPNYKGAPRTGQTWEGGDCSHLVVRGSAYNTPKSSLRVTKRAKFNPNARNDNLGFRVVRVD